MFDRAVCAPMRLDKLRRCGVATLQSLHMLLSDVAGGTAAMSASSAFNDRGGRLAPLSSAGRSKYYVFHIPIDISITGLLRDQHLQQ
jgi:hypothetical protein